MPCQFQCQILLPFSRFPGWREGCGAAEPAELASGNTQYELTQASLLSAMAAALDPHREVALPVPLHKGLRPLYSPPHQLPLMWFLQNYPTKIFAKNKPTLDSTFYKSFNCRLLYLPLQTATIFLTMYAKSCDIFICHSQENSFYSVQFEQSNLFLFQHTIKPNHYLCTTDLFHQFDCLTIPP